VHLAFAHAPGEAGLPPLPEGWALFAEWTFDPTFLVPLLVAGLYLRGLRAYRGGGRSLFRPWRLAMLALGVLVSAVALMGPVDNLSDYSFTWHMVQHMLIAQVSVPLILLAAPFLPVVHGLPEGFRRRWFIPFANHAGVRRVLSTATHPVVAFVSYVMALWAWHAPPAYDAALNNDAVHFVEHLCFVVTSLQMHWHIVNPFPFRSRMHYLVRMGFLFVITVQNGALAALITFAERILYGYDKFTSFWGMTMLEDQLLGGLVMWVGGGMMHLTAILIVFIVYAVEEERKEPRHAALALAAEGKAAIA
jgi:cytochrome c oxidase assembly factor CtaG